MTTIKIPRLVIAGTGSGAGKTTTMVGLAQAFQKRGLKVASFKCGPDYLDPTYHTRVTQQPCQNLDGWMMGKEAVMTTFSRVAGKADIALIEGVMGLFDGASPTEDTGSTAEVAKWLSAPVLLTLDASGMARTVAAFAHGFSTFDPELHLGGLICNRVGSTGHLDLLRKACSNPPIVGGYPKQKDYLFPSRHLGLYSASSQVLTDEMIQIWGERTEEFFDLDQILAIAQEAPLLEEKNLPVSSSFSTRCKIGIALDEAFHFYYEYNLRSLEKYGAELVYFSPIRDEALPQVDAVFLGGGYPEVYAKALSENQSMLDSIRSYAAEGGILYAECGGLMYLTGGIRTLEQDFFPLVGLFPGEAVMAPKIQALGYVEVETGAESLLGPTGVKFKGHQFRYSDFQCTSEEVKRDYQVYAKRKKTTTPEGYRFDNVLASYVHAHWASNPEIPKSIVDRLSH